MVPDANDRALAPLPRRLGHKFTHSILPALRTRGDGPYSDQIARLLYFLSDLPHTPINACAAKIASYQIAIPLGSAVFSLRVHEMQHPPRFELTMVGHEGVNSPFRDVPSPEIALATWHPNGPWEKPLWVDDLGTARYAYVWLDSRDVHVTVRSVLAPHLTDKSCGPREWLYRLRILERHAEHCQTTIDHAYPTREAFQQACEEDRSMLFGHVKARLARDYITGLDLKTLAHARLSLGCPYGEMYHLWVAKQMDLRIEQELLAMKPFPPPRAVQAADTVEDMSTVRRESGSPIIASEGDDAETAGHAAE